ncbi:uncharacterized protein [Triticum aestivum]|uniref:uncharacterized protein n=1 Tax=Triticum aestivum TaxID=4565 RepID=UPI001D029070|nr:uncharacterized protein LOC123110306 [Triticum aestivum]
MPCCSPAPPPGPPGRRGCIRSKALAFLSSKFFQHEVHKDDEVRALFKQVQGEVPGLPIIIMKVASQEPSIELFYWLNLAALEHPAALYPKTVTICKYYVLVAM